MVPSLEVIQNKVIKQQAQPSADDVTMAEMMSAGLHLGHSTEKWHKSMLPFIYGRRSGIHIINLEHTLTYLRRAINVTRGVAANGGVVLFVGKRPFQREILHSAAKHSGQFYVHGKWTTGCLTNHAHTLKKASQDGILLQPDLVVCLDMTECDDVLMECATVNVPTIGLCDTECDAGLVTYAIPGNDDSTASVEMVAYLLAEAAKQE